MAIKAERGYLIPAINSTDIDYESCANRLASSLKQWHPEANVTVVTVDMLPHGDQGGWANDWQMFEISPYRQTIKLEADMLVTSHVDHWWTLFENRDVVISQGCRDWQDRPAQSRHYRRVFDINNLPDVYNAITYWRLSRTAQDFFDLTRMIFQNWKKVKTLLKFPDDNPSTDLVYAIAAQIVGSEQVTLPKGFGPTIVHMKQHIIGGTLSDWTRELVWEHTNPGLRINTVAQWGFFHYNQKDWHDS